MATIGMVLGEAVADDVYWVNGSGGSWSVATNWNTGTLPSDGDIVFISQVGDYVVTLDVDTSIAGLTLGGPGATAELSNLSRTLDLTGNCRIQSNAVVSLAGGSIQGEGAITVEGMLDWSGGSLAGPGTIRIAAAGELELSGSGYKNLNRELENNGTLRWLDGQFNVGAVRLWNRMGGVFEATADGRHLHRATAGAAVLNEGLFEWDMPGTVYLNNGLLFENQGRVEVVQGTLVNNGSLSNHGEVDLSAGTSLTLPSPFTQSASGSLTGAGDVEFSGGTHTLEGAYTVTGSTRIAAAVDFNTDTVFTDEVLLSGTLGGSGTLTVEGTLDWSAGYLSGPGTMRITDTGVLILSGAGYKNLNREVENDGALRWLDGQFNVGAVRLWNRTGGVFEATADGRHLHRATAGAAVLNEGLFEWDVPGTVYLNNGLPFENQGRVEVVQGTLVNNGSLSNHGEVDLSAGTSLVLPSPFTQSASGSLTGAGDVNFSGGTHTLEGAYTVTGLTWIATAVDFNSDTVFTDEVLLTGTLGGSGTLTVEGTLDWSGGQIVGPGTARVAEAGVLTLSGDGYKNLNRELENDGTLRWLAGQFNVGAVRIWNRTGGVFEATADGRHLHRATAGAAVLNEGLFEWDVPGTVYLNNGLPFENQGRVEVVQGTLVNNGSLSNHGEVDLSAGTSLALPSPFTQSASGSLTGAGDVNFSGGAHVMEGAYTVTGLTRIATAVDFNSDTVFTDEVLLTGTLGGSGTLTVEGTLDWSGGQIVGPGTARVAEAGVLTLSGDGYKNLNRELENDGTLRWLAGQFNVGAVRIWNRTGGVFKATADGRHLHRATAGAAVLNEGLFEWDVPGTVYLNNGLPFENHGRVKVVQGTLVNNGSLSNHGEVDLSAGTSLALPSPFTQTASGSLTGAGDVNFSGGAHALEGAYTVTGLTRIATAVDFDSDTVFTDEVLLSGTLGGSGTLTVEGTLDWSGGYLSGPGVMRVADMGVLILSGAGYKNLNRGLENNGTLRWTDGQFNVGAVRLWNRADGVFKAAADGQYLHRAGVGAEVLNEGLFEMDVPGAVYLNNGLPFENAGTIGGRGQLSIVGGVYSSHGTYEPGVPIGSLSVRGDLEIGADERLVLQIAGPVVDVEYDQLKILGPAILRGALEIRLANGYRPRQGDRFVVLEFPSHSGYFDRILGLNLGNELYFQAQFSPTNMVLTTVDTRARPLFESNTLSADGTAQIRISSIAGQDVVISASPSLTDPGWSPVFTNYESGAILDFVDLEATSHTLRFLRVELLPAE